MRKISNDNRIKKLSEKHGKEVVEKEMLKYSRIIFSEKIDNAFYFIAISIAYIFSLISIKFKWVIMEREMFSFLSLAIITAFVIDKIMFESLLKMPTFLFIILLAIINIIVQQLIMGDFSQGMIILIVIVIKKLQQRDTIEI